MWDDFQNGLLLLNGLFLLLQLTSLLISFLDLRERLQMELLNVKRVPGKEYFVSVDGKICPILTKQFLLINPRPFMRVKTGYLFARWKFKIVSVWDAALSLAFCETQY